MTRSIHAHFWLASIPVGCIALVYGGKLHDSRESRAPLEAAAKITGAAERIEHQPGFFEPNLGQWNHPGRFVHRSGSVTMFLEDRGWIMDLRERSGESERALREVGKSVDPLQRARHWRHASGSGVAVRFAFVGSHPRTGLLGERTLPGHSSYFLGEERRWRTAVPRYASARYEGMYPGIDVRVRSANGHPEYDLLCEAGSDLAAVSVQVEGADGLAVDADGTLLIDTALGPIRQPKPKTWECLDGGARREIECEYVLLGDDRFGFAARNRNHANALVIDPGLLWPKGTNSRIVDPGLLWSTFLGGGGFRFEMDMVLAIDVDATGVVTVTGLTASTRFPTTTGAYDTSHNGTSSGKPYDVFVSQLDPRKVGAAQLIYSSFLGGSHSDQGLALAVDSSGVVTVAGYTESANFPTTANAFDTTFNQGTGDAFISRLDPRLVGTAQLVYSTFVGGSATDNISGFDISPSGILTAAGGTASSNFPTTSSAFDTIYNGGFADAFVCRLDLSKVGSAQLIYSTFLGGKGGDGASSLVVDTSGHVNVAGATSSTDFPTVTGSFDTTFNGGTNDGFVGRLDLTKTGSAQLIYGTYLGGLTEDLVTELSVDGVGVLTVAGLTQSANFPTVTGSFDTTYNGGYRDSFVSRLDPSKTGNAQLVYSTFLGGRAGGRGVGNDVLTGLAVNGDGVVTVSGMTDSADFPSTRGAYRSTHNGVSDIFVSRLDPSLVGSAQMIYSTFLGGTGGEFGEALAVDASGVATVAGWTLLTNITGYPTTRGAYIEKSIGVMDAVITRLDMGIAMRADTHELPLATGGPQRLILNAGSANANRFYWIFGSLAGTRPGINLLGVHIPLNPDAYTNVVIGAANSRVFTNFRGRLDGGGLATATFNVPANLPLTFYHAYVVHDASGKIYMASNAVPLRLK